MSENSISVEVSGMPDNRGVRRDGVDVAELEKMGAVTGEKPYKSENPLYKDSLTLEQTVPMRAERAEMLREALEIRKKKIGDREEAGYLEHKDKYRQLSKIEREYLSAKAVEVTSLEWKVTTTYTMLNRDQLEKGGKPIVFVSGASNGLQSVDSFAMELADQHPDRPILVLGYPEAATQGGVDRKFVAAVMKNKEGVGPHADMMEAVISYALEDQLGEDGSIIDVVGFSAGAMIAMELMQREKWQSKIGKTTLVCPAGMNKQTMIDLGKELGKEDGKLKKLMEKGIEEWREEEYEELTDVLKYSFIDDVKKDGQKVLRMLTWIMLGKRSASDFFLKSLSSIKNKDGRLTVISAGKDKVTKSAEVFSEDGEMRWGLDQEKVNAIVLPDEIHAGPFIHPKNFVDVVKKSLE